MSLSGDGNVLAIGAPNEDGAATGINNPVNEGSVNSGAAYVFRRHGADWTQEAYVKASNTGSFDRFGGGVALSADGHTLAVGATGESSNAATINGNQNDNSAVDSGAVYVFVHDGSQWVQEAYVKASNAGGGDLFGARLALSSNGDTLATNSAAESSDATGINGVQTNNNAIGSGAAYIFTRLNGNWTQQAYLKASNSQTGDGFGASIALSADGNTFAASAPAEDSNATGVNGSESDNSAANSGAVYVFVRGNGQWVQQAYLKASNTETADAFGSAIALSPDGNTLAVTAPNEDSSALGVDGDQTNNNAGNSGAVYVFARSSNGWRQRSYVKASNTDSDDSFGGAHGVSFSSAARGDVALAVDGHGVPVMAVGGPNEDSNATGINGNQADNSVGNSGAVYLY